MRIALALFMVMIVNSGAGQTDSKFFSFDEVATFRLDTTKPTVLYFFASWCGDNLKDYHAVSNLLQPLRDRINFVVFIDTSNHLQTHARNEQHLIKPDGFIDLPSKFRRKSVMKKITRSFNLKFGTGIFRLGPSSMILLNKDLAYIMAIPVDNRNILVSLLKG